MNPVDKMLSPNESGMKMPASKEILHQNTNHVWPRSGMKTLNARGVFSYPHFERDKVIATELFDEEDFEGFERLLRHIHSKQRFYEGDRSHFLLCAMYNAEFNYPGWPEDLDLVKEVFLFSANAFAECETRRLFRAMVNKQRLHDSVDLHPGIITIRSSIFSYEGFEQDKRDAMNAYLSGYDNVFEKCFDKILTKQKIHDANVDLNDGSGDIQLKLAGLPSVPEEGEDDASTTIQSPEQSMHSSERANEEEEILHKGSFRDVLRPIDDNVQMKDAEEQKQKAKENFIPEASSKVTDVRPYLSECSICLEAVTSHIFVPCGHLALCSSCASKAPYNERSRKSRHRCPICRKQSTDIIKVFY